MRPFAVVLLCVASWPVTGFAAPSMRDPRLKVATVVESGGPPLAYPSAFAFLASDDILVLEKYTGRVRRIKGGRLEPEPVLDLPVNAQVARGLLGIAIGPADGAQRVWLFATAATRDGDPALGNRVWRYDWDPRAGRLVAPLQLLDLPVTPGPDHDGGALRLDGLGALYVTIGDENRNGQLENERRGSPPTEVTSAILKVDAATGVAARGNPLAPYCATSQTACQSDADCGTGQVCLVEVARIYGYGIRNSFGLALDPLTGRLWDTENGPDAYDEVNLVEPGFNSGWRDLMGPDRRDPDDTSALFWPPTAAGAAHYSDPEFAWRETIAPTALTFAVDSSWGARYDSTLVVGAAKTGQLYGFTLDDARRGFRLQAALRDGVADTPAERDTLAMGDGFGLVTGVDMGPDRHVYVLSYGEVGALYRIEGDGTPVELLEFFVE